MQQDMYERSFLLIVSFAPSRLVLLPDRWIGIRGPHPPQRDASCLRRRVSVWEQAGVPGGNTEGCSGGNRTLADQRTGPACLLVERPGRDREINHRPNIRRDDVRRRKTRGQLLLLARLRRSEQSPDDLPDTRLPARIPVSTIPK